ncbi:MAG: HIG1 domain-containing protein [Acidocella sp.]|nr:HIG1 domain-containing protein [Acidocella sp.]
MKTFLMVLLAIDMLAVVIVMLVGAIGLVDANRSGKTSNRLMRLRVALQAVAIGLVVLLLMTGR